jgi:hypothetical protein
VTLVELSRRRKGKDKINELEKKKQEKYTRQIYTGINGFKKGYQSQIKLVKYENGGLLTGSHNILSIYSNYFCQILNSTCGWRC